MAKASNIDSNHGTLSLLRRLAGDHARAYAPQYAVALVLMAFVAGCTALSAWFMKYVIDDIFVKNDHTALVWVPVAIAVLFILKGCAAYFQEVWLSRIGNRLVADIQRQTYDHILKMDVGFFQRRTSSELITRLTQQATAARDMLNMLAVGFGRDLLTIIGLVAVMVSQDPIMAAICLTSGPFVAVGLKHLVKRSRKAASSQFQSTAHVVGTMRETSQGIRIVKSFQLEEVLRQRMHAALKAVERMANKMVRARALVNPLLETAGGLAVAAVVLYAGWRSMAHGQTPGQFFAFITALLLTADPARRLSRLQLQLATAAVGVRMMYELLDTPVSEIDREGATDLVVRGGEVRLDAVTFGYVRDAPVLDNLSLVAPAGKMTALVGLSGTGKTTILNLIQRFWDPTQGTVLIDGQPIGQHSLESVRGQVALVSQDVFLFEGTVGENIRAGRRDAKDDDVVAAARAAHADGFIRVLPNGYDTPVGELGSQLSGGQRQRVALARAFLKDAPIILLDEPTSALDSETEQIIQDALADLTRGRTTLVIAHRLSTVADADIVHVIDGGRLAESGTHRDLIQRGGLYSRLYRIQFATQSEDRTAAVG
jgi:ATP-binding cassette, subfamily B, bacterial MsbA